MKLGKYELDCEQSKIVYDESKALLVVAGAGSGKTLTIIGKIMHLIVDKNIDANEILCISFTNEASLSLKNKIKDILDIDINVYTFHKLGLEILNGVNYEICDDNLLSNIIDEYFSSYKKFVLKYLRVYYRKKYINNSEIEYIKKLIICFISHFKCNNYKIDKFSVFLNEVKNTFNYFEYRKEKALLIIILNIYIYYSKYLEDNNEIDFNDMISLAIDKLNDTKHFKHIKYIIIDEYQDTSLVRFMMVKEIIEITGAKLMVVGDDFQSIYGFTGCNLDLFIGFNKYFSNSKILKIQTTYRNCDELIDIAGSFIMKNKKQIVKNLHSDKHLLEPIKIIYYSNIKKDFLKIIDSIDPINTIMVLGRNNSDINVLLGDDIKAYGNKLIYKEYDITYYTVHKSKGLESDCVIIINLLDDICGFPSKLKNNRIMRLVNNTYDNYLYGEERRLFYVALTRTKNRVFLFVEENSKSCFVSEIQRIIRYKKNNH